VLRRTPQDIFFVATILAEKSQSRLSDWTQLLEKSGKMEQIFRVTYAEACANFESFEANLNSVEFDVDESMDGDLFERFLQFHSQSFLRLKSLFPLLKISSARIKAAVFTNIINIILPQNSSFVDTSITFGEILGFWQMVSENNDEQSALIRERIKLQTDSADKVILAQCVMDNASAEFTWNTASAYQEVRFPQYLGHVSVFVNPDISKLIDSSEAHIDSILKVLLTFQKSLDETRLDLSQFLEDMYIIRSFLQTVYACSYWTCCMLTITFERTGDEDQEPFLTWGGDPSQLDTRNAAIKSYKRLIASFFQQNKMFANERLIDHLNYIRQAIPQLNEITGQMRAVYYSYRDYTFFPISMAWFPSIILVEEDSQDAAILCLGPAGSSRACQCFSSLMNSARTKLFVNVSRITKDKEFGQPSILTTLCGRSIGVEASMQLFGRSVHLSLLLQARSIKNAFKNCYLQTINRFNQRDESSFFDLLSSTNLKEQLLEGIILAVLVKLSSVDKNDRSCRLVSEMLESSNQVAKDATEGHTHSSIALASLLIIRDACSEVALRTMCCWKFNFEEQSLRIEVGSFIAIAHNLEVSPSMNWLTFLACDDSYLIKCLQSVALSPRTLEDSWNHQAHSMFSHNLASLIGRSLSIRNSSPKRFPLASFWQMFLKLDQCSGGPRKISSLLQQKYPIHYHHRAS
jgi:hypothetical protein